MAKNKVIAGDFEGYIVVGFFGSLSINKPLSFSPGIPLNKDTVTNYELVTEETRKSASSGIARGAIGGFILGPIGLLAGLSAKNKGTYNVIINFKDGKKSLLEIDDKFYKNLVKVMF